MEDHYTIWRTFTSSFIPLICCLKEVISPFSPFFSLKNNRTTSFCVLCCYKNKSPGSSIFWCNSYHRQSLCCLSLMAWMDSCRKYSDCTLRELIFLCQKGQRVNWMQLSILWINCGGKTQLCLLWVTVKWFQCYSLYYKCGSLNESTNMRMNE